MNSISMIVVGVGALLWSLLMGGVGWNLRDNKAVYEVHAQQKADMDGYNRLELHYNAVTADLQKQLEATQQEQHVVTQYVDRIVDRPIYRSDCLDDAGLRLANAALLARAAIAPAADAAVSGANATGR